MSDERLLIISADGHACPHMEDYRPYLSSEWHEQFDAFCAEYREKGSTSFEPKSLLSRCDPDVVDDWVKNVVEPGHLDGYWDSEIRLKEFESVGIVAEVLFPDFGLPFQLYPPFLNAYIGHPFPSNEEVDVGYRAYNRWLADFMSVAPGRFGGLAMVQWHDVDKALEEIRWAKEAKFRGVVIPHFTDRDPLFAPMFEPIWSLIEDLELVANSHGNLTSTSIESLQLPKQLPHPAVSSPLFVSQQVFFTHNVLTHLVWGGVLERHPRLKVAFTEQGAGWVVGKLRFMDHQFEDSYLRRDVREVIAMRPSDYYRRQCYMGASGFSRAEVEARHEIGVDQMMLGNDYPHHEGTWSVGNDEYYRATLGAAQVPVDEARRLLGETALNVYGFDRAQLAKVATRVGPRPSDILTPLPPGTHYRGDVERPLSLNG
jgi:predicted TIM-barrel fold metal-dependent hydrolase